MKSRSRSLQQWDNSEEEEKDDDNEGTRAQTNYDGDEEIVVAVPRQRHSQQDAPSLTWEQQ